MVDLWNLWDKWYRTPYGIEGGKEHLYCTVALESKAFQRPRNPADWFDTASPLLLYCSSVTFCGVPGRLWLRLDAMGGPY